MDNYGKTICCITAFILCLLLVPGPAVAVPGNPIGDPVPGSSWNQLWGYWPNVVEVEAFLINDTGTQSVDFELPGDSYSEAGWSSAIVNPDYMLIQGPLSITTFSGKEYYTGDDHLQYFDHVLFAYDSSGLIDQTTWNWDGNTWNFRFLTWDPDDPIFDRTTVPEPSTLLLFGTGLVGIGIFRRRLRS